jgi:hypothetical protein
MRRCRTWGRPNDGHRNEGVNHADDAAADPDREGGLSAATGRGTVMKRMDLRGLIPESWACIDCGINTAPGCLNRIRTEEAFAADWNGEGVPSTFDERTEVYIVKPATWKAAGMEDDKELWDATGTMAAVYVSVVLKSGWAEL